MTASEVSIYAPGSSPPLGGGLQGASFLSRETARWNASMGSPDQILNGVKAILDARSNDTAQNDAWAQSAVTTHRDAIVGAKFTINCKPNVTLLGMDPDSPATDDWLKEFTLQAEARFDAVAESNAHWLDAARRRTLTQMCRLAVSSAVLSGEVLAPVEYIYDSDRPCRTAIHLVSPARLSNPNNTIDTRYLRRGIHMDYFGRHLGYWLRQGHPGEYYDSRQYTWAEVPAQLPWGRKQMIYLNDPLLVEQSRGVGDMSAALPHMRMAKKHSQIALQNAVINATYAAALESGLPPPELAQMMGAMSGGVSNATDVVDGWQQAIGDYLGIIQAFMSGASNIAVDGAQIPVLPPGTTFKLLNAGNGGGASYADFEASLNRKTASALNMSYEEFTGDYTKTNYSSAKASDAKTDRFMNARKKFTADDLASNAFTLWLEEELSNPDSPVPLPPTWSDRLDYYKPYQKDAISKSDWIGSGSGQIDELKETQAAILRIRSGLSTWAIECAKLGLDWRDMTAQQKRELAAFTEAGLDFSADASKPTEQLATGVDKNVGAAPPGATDT